MAPLLPKHIETDRLHLEQLCHENVDLLEFYTVSSHHEEGIEETTEYLSWNPHQTPKTTAEYIDYMEEQWEDAEKAEYIVRPKEGEEGVGEIAGTTGFFLDWERQIAELSIWLRKRFWGRGYSEERATALMDIAFNRLELEFVTANHVDGNEKAKRATTKYIERHGGQYDGLLRNWKRWGDKVLDFHRYSISREQYHEATR